MAAEEQLTALVNEGYVVLDSIKKDCLNKREDKSFDPNAHIKIYEEQFND